jgi:hypothetical protein
VTLSLSIAKLECCLRIVQCSAIQSVYDEEKGQASTYSAAQLEVYSCLHLAKPRGDQRPPVGPIPTTNRLCPSAPTHASTGMYTQVELSDS